MGQILGWTDSTVTPEVGQTTTIKVWNEARTVLLATHSGLTGTSFDVPDASFGDEAVVYIETGSSRTDENGTFESLQSFGHWVKVRTVSGASISASGVATVAFVGDVGSGYSEVGTIGNTTTDGSAYGAATNEKGVFSITVPSGGVWVKKAFVKVQDTNAGNKFKPVLYTGVTATDTLVKVGQELVFPTTLSLSATDYSVDWNADGSAYFIPAGTYGLGYHTDSNTDIKSVVASATFWNADTYSDGPGSPFGATSSSSRVICVWFPYSVTGP